MSGKIRNEKHKNSNEERFALCEDENTSALINIAQKDTARFLNCYKT